MPTFQVTEELSDITGRRVRTLEAESREAARRGEGKELKVETTYQLSQSRQQVTAVVEVRDGRLVEEPPGVDSEQQFDDPEWDREFGFATPCGEIVAFPGPDQSPEGVDYVRILDRQGEELWHWRFNEWRDDPQRVMGAILGAIVGGVRRSLEHISGKHRDPTEPGAPAAGA